MSVYFRQGYSVLDLGYRGNGKRLEAFARRYEALRQDTDLIVGGVVVTGFASPEGTFKLNRRLSQRRSAVIAGWLAHLGVPDSLIRQEPKGIDWEGLEEAIDTLPGVPLREEALDIIRHTPELGMRSGVEIELRKQKLIALGGGRTWKYVYGHIFPVLRNSGVRLGMIVQRRPGLEALPEAIDSVTVPPVIEAVDTVAVDTVVADTLVPVAPVRRHTVLALRTNLLVPAFNCGFEVPVGDRWSVGADYYYPWRWRKADNKDCFQLTFFSGEARCWLGRQRSRLRRLLGHSLAAYGVWGYYDFGRNWSGEQGEFWSVGADYTFAVPVFRRAMHLEFQVAIGYLHAHSHPYDVKEWGGRLINRRDVYKRYNYFGPTKVAVSLVLPIKRKEVSR